MLIAFFLIQANIATFGSLAIDEAVPKAGTYLEAIVSAQDREEFSQRLRAAEESVAISNIKLAEFFECCKQLYTVHQR